MSKKNHSVEGTKVADIQISLQYPIVSAFEFEFLKTEKAVLDRIDNCTIYLIVQRSLTYFDNVVLKDGYIFFMITDGTGKSLACRINLVAAGICAPNEAVDIEVSFFSKPSGTHQPFRDLGAIKVYKLDGSFVVWWSPQKILYEMIVNGLTVEIDEDGDPFAFLDFKIHYIGKSFSQKVWQRLTGHEKMQRILTLQGPVGGSPEAQAPFEISLILLSVVGITDIPEIPRMGFTIPDGIKPIVHTIDSHDDQALYRFVKEPFVKLGDEAMTREVEAMLINQFKPKENNVKFKNYPYFKGGMRSKGCSFTTITIEQLPALLYTDHYSYQTTKTD